MIGGQPFRHAFAVGGGLCRSLTGGACDAAAVDIRLDAGRVQDIFKGKFGTSHGNVDRSIIEQIAPNAEALVVGAQDIFELCGIARLGAEGAAVNIDDLLRRYFEFIITPVQDLVAKPACKWEDGNEYPLVKVEISSASHPFYTGKHKTMDTGGRVDRFKRRYQK